MPPLALRSKDDRSDHLHSAEGDQAPAQRHAHDLSGPLARRADTEREMLNADTRAFVKARPNEVTSFDELETMNFDRFRLPPHAHASC